MRCIFVSVLLSVLLSGCAYPDGTSVNATSVSDTMYWPNQVIKVYDARGNRTGTVVIRK